MEARTLLTTNFTAVVPLGVFNGIVATNATATAAATRDNRLVITPPQTP